MMTPDIRKKIHEALKPLVKVPMTFDAKGDPFLILKSPKGHDIELEENDGDIELMFGVSGESFSFNPDLDADGDEADAPDERSILREIQKTVLGIVDERLFAAEYSRGKISVGGLFASREFDELSGKPDFVSVSWNDRWTRGE